MRLLYCITESKTTGARIVAGWHEAEQNIEGTEYETEDSGPCRVIPYPYPLETLEKVGPEPAPPPFVRAADEQLTMQDIQFMARTMPLETPDSRPFAEPKETPQILRWFASQVRFETITAGIVWNNIPVKTDRISQLLITNMMLMASTLPPDELMDFTQSSFSYQIRAGDVPDLNKQVNAFVQSCRTIEAQCLADLGSEDPRLKTYADVENMFTQARSRTVRFAGK